MKQPETAYIEEIKTLRPYNGGYVTKTRYIISIYTITMAKLIQYGQFKTVDQAKQFALEHGIKLCKE
mgnify:CR=1 FL=1